MPTSGIKLIKTLGLSKIYSKGDVYISRIILPHSQKINVVFYDSLKGRVPKAKIKFQPYVGMVFSGKHLASDEYNRPTLAPAISIENWNGLPQNYMFLLVDLSYQMHLDRKNFSRLPERLQRKAVKEGVKVVLGTDVLKEFVTLPDLKDKGNIAPSTFTWRQDRNKIMGAENKTLKFIDLFLNEADHSVTFAFQTDATSYDKAKGKKNLVNGDRAYKAKKKRVSPLNLEILPNQTKKYELQLRFLDFFDWLSTHPEGQPITAKDLKEMMNVSNVQVFSTSPSFQYQSYNYFASQLDASAYPTNIAPKVWDKRLGGEYFLDKHLYGLLQSIEFFLNPMASMLTNKLKKRGLI